MERQSIKKDIYMDDFSVLVPKPHIPQALTIQYIARMMAVSQCARMGSPTQENILSAYEKIMAEMDKYAVSPQHISKRQVHLFPDQLEAILSSHAIPSANLYPDILKFPNGEELDKRMDYFDQAVTALFPDFYPENVNNKPDDIIHVTCSGYLSPSPVQRFLNKRRWLDVVVTHSYHMGCYGAFPPVRMAAGFLSHAALMGQPKNQIDIVHTELLFTHLDITKTDPNNIVNMTLFADGYVKYSLKHAEKDGVPKGGLKLLAMHDTLIKDSEEEMTWKPSHYNFDMYLSKSVPILIRDSARRFIDKLCLKAGINFLEQKSSMIFAIHPGGPKILDHLQELLSLEDWQLAPSRQVLYENGNMSSATVPQIWKKISEDQQVSSGTKIVTVSFGPGLTSTGFILEKA